MTVHWSIGQSVNEEKTKNWVPVKWFIYYGLNPREFLWFYWSKLHKTRRNWTVDQCMDMIYVHHKLQRVFCYVFMCGFLSWNGIINFNIARMSHSQYANKLIGSKCKDIFLLLKSVKMENYLHNAMNKNLQFDGIVRICNSMKLWHVFFDCDVFIV